MRVKHQVKHPSIDNKIESSNPPYTWQRKEMAEKNKTKYFFEAFTMIVAQQVKHPSIDKTIERSNPPYTQQHKEIPFRGPLSQAGIHYIKHTSIYNKIDGSNPPSTHQCEEMAFQVLC